MSVAVAKFTNKPSHITTILCTHTDMQPVVWVEFNGKYMEYKFVTLTAKINDAIVKTCG